MDIQVDKASDVPLHEQIAAQIVLMIGAGRLKPGASLPSVRALALRLGIHRNTISRAYHDLTLNLLVEKRAGRRLVVYASGPGAIQDARDLDDLIAVTIAEAQRRGYSLHQLYERLRGRLRSAPPDRLLVTAEEAGMRTLLARELAVRFRCRVDACTPVELWSAPQRALGAVVVSPPGYIRRDRAVLAPDHPLIAITYSGADPPLETIRRLTQPSLIAVVSVSAYFLEMARAVLAPAVGRRHSMRGYLMTGKRLQPPRAADLIVCDALTYPAVRAQLRTGTVLVHHVIAESCLDKIDAAMASQRSPVRTTRRQK